MKSYFFALVVLCCSALLAGCSGFAPDSFVSDDDLLEGEYQPSEYQPDNYSDEDFPTEPVVLDQGLVDPTDAFLAVLLTDRVAAYASTHELFKFYTTEEDFVSFMDEFPVLVNPDSVTDFYDYSVYGNEAEMNGFIENDVDGTFEVNFLYDRTDDGDWLVSGFDIYFLY